jgi:hypothetical protein
LQVEGAPLGLEEARTGAKPSSKQGSKLGTLDTLGAALGPLLGAKLGTLLTLGVELGAAL